MKSTQIWRGIDEIADHPGNGHQTGGAVISTVFVRLSCGHVRSYPKSKTPSGNNKVRCPECEKAPAEGDKPLPAPGEVWVRDAGDKQLPTPSVPFEPEPDEVLRARWARAMEGEPYDHRAIMGGAILPSEQRRHVFDFENGYRLIASRDLIPEMGGVVLHVSLSAFKPVPSVTSFQDASDRVALLMQRLGHRVLFKLGEFKSSPKGIYHVFFKDPTPATGSIPC